MAPLTKKYITDLFVSFTEANTIDDLWGRFTDFCAEQELIHGRISIYDLEVEIGSDTVRHLRSWPSGPDSWAEYYFQNGLYVHDRSFHLIFEHRTEALEWQDMDRLTRQGTEANRVFVEMRNFGIGNGLLVGKSSLIKHKTILMGIAGPGRVFRDFKKKYYQALIHCLHTFNSCYVDLAVRDDKLAKLEEPGFQLTERAREIVKLMSHDYTSGEIAEKLNISENGLNQALKRLRKTTDMKTRAGIVAEAIRTKRIQ